MVIDLHRLGEVNWPELIREIRARLVLNQRELAERCKVSPQAVSAWSCGRRRPDTHGCRMLLELCREAGLEIAAPDDTSLTAAESPGTWDVGEDDSDLQELIRIFRGLAPEKRPELLSFARYCAQG